MALSFFAPSTYREHVAQRRDPAKLSARAQRDLKLKPDIARIFAEKLRRLRRAQCLAPAAAGRVCRRTLHREAADGDDFCIEEDADVIYLATHRQNTIDVVSMDPGLNSGFTQSVAGDRSQFPGT